MLKRVLILYTGGTFGMVSERKNPEKFGLASLSNKRLREMLLDRAPELCEIADCDIDVLFNLDSSHVGPEHWTEMSHAIAKASRKYSGVVVLHGTDTLAYSAAALSLLVPKLGCPVILTGAQRPLFVLRNDARRNLVSAVEIAAMNHDPIMNRVLVFFGDRLYLGSAVRKRSATLFEGFDSPRFPVLADVGSDVSLTAGVSELARLRSKRKLAYEPHFSNRVLRVGVTPAFPPTALRGLIKAGIDAIVLSVFPSGTGPTHDPHFVDGLRALQRDKIPVIVVTEGYGHAADQKTYRAARIFDELGCIRAGDLTPECAFALVSFILGQEQGRKKFAKYWNDLLPEVPA